MLGLKLATDPRWVDLAEKTLEEILTDHAYCEQKAATACISLVQSFPDKTELVESLAPIVTEEWGHFRLVLAELKKRDDKWFAEIDPSFFGNQPTNNYCKWFHVCEHEANHRGQITMIRKRLPGSKSDQD